MATLDPMSHRDPPTRRFDRHALAAVLFALAAGAYGQDDREMLHACLDTYEGDRRDGHRFTRDYGRHVLYCNYRVDMLDGHGERRDAYERWRTQIYQNDLARMAAAGTAGAAPAAPPARRRTTTPTTPPAPRLDSDALRFARCLTERADRLALTEPDLDQDPARARRLAEEMTEGCLSETQGR